MSSKLIPVSVTVTGPNGQMRDVEFSQDVIMVGTGPTAHVRLDDKAASGTHCMLKQKADGTLVVMDLGSDSGTELNGKEIEGETRLEDGALLKVGASRLQVHFGGHVAAGATVSIRRKTDDKVPTAHYSAAVSERTDPEATERHQVVPPTLQKKGEAKDANRALSNKDKKPIEPVAAQQPAREAPVDSGLGGLAHRMLMEELPEDERPAPNNRMLESVLIWKDTVVEVRHTAAGEAVVLGNQGNVTFRLSTEGWGGQTPYELVKRDGTVAAPNGGKLTVRRQTKVHAEATGSTRLELGDRAAVTVGDVTLMVQWVARAKVVATSPWKSMDFYFQKILAGTIATHVLLLLIFQLTPMDPDLDADDLFKNPNAFAKLILKPELEEKKKKVELSGKKDGGKHKDKEGKFGKKEVKQKEAASSKKGAPVVDPNKREKDRQIAFNSGVLGILKKSGGAVSNVFGPGGLGTGINNALGGLNGVSSGDAGGAGGLGSRGTGPGGGGSALGIGGLGSGTGRGSGGRGDVDLGGRGKGTTKITPGKTIVEGGLSKEEIGRVIKRYLSQIKYCYEKELTRNPNLAGKVVTSFTISGTGKVTECDVVESSLNDPTVEDCVSKIILRIQFPQPKGGGIVLVSYPFIFQSSGE